MGRIKCIVGTCRNHTDLMREWKRQTCSVHGRDNVLCPCVPPAGYQMFYAQGKTKHEQSIWAKNLQLNIQSWTKNMVVCSEHFIDGYPTREHPYPQKDPKSFVNTKRPIAEVQTQEHADLETIKRSRLDETKEIHSEQTDLHVMHQDDMKKINTLQQQIAEMEAKLQQKEQLLKNQEEQSKFTAKKLKANQNQFHFYTGLTPELFTLLFENILPYTDSLRYWRGPKRAESHDKDDSRNAVRKEILCKEDQFFLWLIKCRLNLKVKDLACRFGISPSVVSSIFSTWTKLLRPILENFIIWPTQSTIAHNLPDRFKEYPKTRAIIDCFELGIQHPKSLKAQAETYSNYKGRNTMKYLIAVTPNVACSFISKGFGGRTSDRKITDKSGIVEKFEEGDDCMADRGFDIEDLLKSKRATLNAPPRTKGKRQLSENEVTKTRRIASARIIVENFIGRMRNFNILRETIPIALSRQIDDIVVCISSLCNLTNGTDQS